MRITVKNNFDLNKVRKRVHSKIPMMINDAAGIIRSDITAGIRYGRDIEGKPFIKLKPATIKAKRKSGSKYPRRVLHDKGTMYETYMKKEATKPDMRAIIKVADVRSKSFKGYQGGIGEVHHTGSKNHPVRPWFGISATASKKIQKNLRVNIVKALGKEWRLV